jgi:CheY-like chemotaxis protein
VANVLLVEDDDQVRVLAESYLEEQGHTVWTAATADGAFAILNSSRPIDLLFTDIGLKEEIHGGIDTGQLDQALRMSTLSARSANWSFPWKNVCGITGRPLEGVGDS